MASHFLSQQPVYLNGLKATDQSLFPKTEVFSGFNRPSRIQGSIEDLEVEGTIPKAVEGTFYRIQSDHKYAPMYENDIHFNGDGIVGAFQISGGHVDWKQRYVETDRYKAERVAHKNLFGKYRNPYTDHETVKGLIRTAANTNIVFWRGVLLALKEDGPPFALDPETLTTIGRYDFDGQVLSPTFTAHPKVDPQTGELIGFGYEAGGNGNDASKEVVLYSIGPEGTKREEAWYTAPYCGLIHDCGITENYVVLPMSPLKADINRMRKGGNHWAWDPNEDQVYGILPRHGGKREDAIWVRSRTAFHGHVAGAYEEDGKIIFDVGVANGNVFFFFPPDNHPAGEVAHRNKIYSPVTRWIFDPKTLRSGDWVEPAKECPFSSEFTRIDERYNAKKYKQLWTLQVDPSRPYDVERCGSPAGGLFNVLTHYNWETSEVDEYYPGPRTTFQEPVFIPESDDAPEGHGYLLAMMNRLDELRNDIGIFDAQKLHAGPVAMIKLPLKFKLGFHGNWVDQREIDQFREARQNGGTIGPARPAQSPLPWQMKENGFRNA